MCLRNQIIERKVIELVQSHAKFKDVPYTPESWRYRGARPGRRRRRSGNGSHSRSVTSSRSRAPTRTAGTRVESAGRFAKPGSAHRKDESMNPFSAASESTLRPIDPRLSYRDYQRQRQMLTLGDLLLENRIILLQGEIHDGNANEVGDEAALLAERKPSQSRSTFTSIRRAAASAPTLAIYDTMQILLLPGGDVLRRPGRQRGRRAAGRRSQRQAFRAAPRQGHDPPALRLRSAARCRTSKSKPTRSSRRARSLNHHPLAAHRPSRIERIAKDTESRSST